MSQREVGGAGYPITVDVVAQLNDRDRVTTLFRLILAVPQLVLVGGVGVIGYDVVGLRDVGALAAVAFTMAVISWFGIIFADIHPRGLWDFAGYYMRWLVRVTAYVSLLRDDYPPFGDESYPTTFAAEFPSAGRDRWSVGLRLIYVIPHVVVLFFVDIAWTVVTVIAWFAILFTGSYPPGLYDFSVGALRWNARVDAYVLLMRDEYPPFSLQP